jgi:CrcB protein
VILALEYKLAAAAFGGSIGCACRVLVGHYLGRPSGFPWATFAINVLGSFLLGVLFACTKDRAHWYFLLGAGFCGGFTTFSAFSLETLALIEGERWLEAKLYAVGSVVAGVVGAWLGVLLGKWI